MDRIFQTTHFYLVFRPMELRQWLRTPAPHKWPGHSQCCSSAKRIEYIIIIYYFMIILIFLFCRLLNMMIDDAGWGGEHVVTADTYPDPHVWMRLFDERSHFQRWFYIFVIYSIYKKLVFLNKLKYSIRWSSKKKRAKMANDRQFWFDSLMRLRRTLSQYWNDDKMNETTNRSNRWDRRFIDASFWISSVAVYGTPWPRRMSSSRIDKMLVCVVGHLMRSTHTSMKKIHRDLRMV